ncbi:MULTISPECIES: 4Fe-4S binding protein [unclassified Polynucleobacter]|uniref:4Fe-4S binding protein n=1 Tax=unclassified Polynucleobacter TaxID=2640945 RepID=UPI0024904161|nr:MULTISPECIES: 4Fe-4S binding protein [unclassified Polynucleobacter]
MTRTLVCSCNHTMPLEDAFFKKYVEGHEKIYDGLCRQEIGAFIKEVAGDETIVVACTQERELFNAISMQSEKPLVAPIQFINIRETAGWGRDSQKALPKIATLLELAKLPAPEPLPTVSYDSTRGRVCIIGPGKTAFALAQELAQDLAVTVIVNDRAILPIQKNYMIVNANIQEVSGFLGKFKVSWQSSNPIQLDLCTRCGACIDACPEQAIDESFQIDMQACKSHQECEKACGAIGAIQFQKKDTLLEDEFDVIVDLHPESCMKMPEPPKGYFFTGLDPIKQAQVVNQVNNSIGEFEKPRFFAYQEKICAHGRNGQVGCNACIDICSTQAITSIFEAGKGRVSVNPHLCMGCGACATACPSGAMTYANPTVPYLGTKFKTMVDTFAKTAISGASPTVLFHSGVEGGDQWINALGRASKLHSKKINGIPAQVIPISLHHIASTGIDLWLGMLTHGVAEIAILASGEESPQYLGMLKDQIKISSEILLGLGYQERIHLIEMSATKKPEHLEDLILLDQSLSQLQSQECLVPSASFAFAKEKRATLEMSLEHLLEHAPLALGEDEAIPLSSASCIGGLAINQDSCTLCMSCVSACPEGALLDHLEIPQLGFIEKNCVQCGLCQITCPENALTLQPRLKTIEQRKTRVTLNETKPFHCIKCAKPFATEKMMETMLAKIGGHPAFSGEAQKRLKMCSDCRVIDMMQS